jgi:hypothetical protein
MSPSRRSSNASTSPASQSSSGPPHTQVHMQSQAQQSLVQPPPLQPTTTTSQGPSSVPQFKLPGPPASLARKQKVLQSPANPSLTLDDFNLLTMPPDPKRKRSYSGSSPQPQKPTRSTTARDQVSFSSTISL